MNNETIYLPSLDEHIQIEFEFIQDKDERGPHEYFVFHSFKAKQTLTHFNENLDLQERKIWINIQLTEQQIVEAEHQLERLRKERCE